MKNIKIINFTYSREFTILKQDHNKTTKLQGQIKRFTVIAKKRQINFTKPEKINARSYKPTPFFQF